MTTLKAIFFLLLMMCFSLTTSASPAKSQHFENADSGSEFISGYNDQQFDIRHNIPGEPEIDYPIYSEAPQTSFTCENRHEGYYADMETRCQVFRICTNTDLTGEGFAFLCPNGTLFSQRDFVCDWYRNVDCSESKNFYFMNEALGNVIESEEDMKRVVEEMMAFPVKKITSSSAFGATLSKRRPTGTSVDGGFGTRTQSGRTGDVNRSSAGRKIQNNSSPKTRTQNNGQYNQNYPNSSGRGGGKGNNEILAHKKGSRGEGSSTISGSRFGENPVTKNNRVHTTNSFPSGGKVYVNSLGELSTDRESSFDPKSERIFSATDENSRNIHRSTLGTNAADLNLRKNTNEIHKSLPGKVNSHFSEIGSSSIPERRPLSFAERINYELNSFPVFGTSGGGGGGGGEGESSEDFIQLLNPKPAHFGNGNQLTQKSDSTSEKLNNLGAKINSAFDSTESNPTVAHLENRFRSSKTLVTDFSISDLNIELPADRSIDNAVHSSGEGNLVSDGARTRNNDVHRPTVTQTSSDVENNFRQGRARFQIIGSGFKKSGTESQQFVPTHKPAVGFSSTSKNYYLPPEPHRILSTPFKTARQRVADKLHEQNNAHQKTFSITSTTSEPTILTETNERSQLDIRIEDSIPSLLVDVNDKNAVEDIRPFTNNDVVKKRAENLLLQGVHLTLYESSNSSNIVDSNSIIETSEKLNTDANKNRKTTIKTELSSSTENPNNQTVASSTESLKIIVEDDDAEQSETKRISQTFEDNNFLKKDEIRNETQSSILKDEKEIENISNNKTVTLSFTSSNSSLTINYPTGKPIEYSKKPYRIQNYPKTPTTTKKVKLRRRRINRLENTPQSSTISEFESQNNSTEMLAHDGSDDDDDADAPGSRSTNAYGIRGSLRRRPQNETSKYTVLKRPKTHFIYDDRKTNSNLKNRTRTSILSTNSSSENTLPTRIPSVSNKIKHLIVKTNETELEMSNNNNTNNDENYDNDNSQRPKLSAGFTPINIAERNNRNGLNTTPKPSPGASTSTFQVQNTQVTISKTAKGHSFIIQPAYTRQSLIATTATTESPLVKSTKAVQFPIGNLLPDGFTSLKPPILVENHQTHQQKQSSSFFVPFPNVLSAKPSQNTHLTQEEIRFQTFSPIPSTVPQGTTPSTATTSRSIQTAKPQIYFRVKSYGSIDASDDGASFYNGAAKTTLNNPRAQAQRRLDFVDDEYDEPENSIYRGVSSYNVPLKSVGRLSGDIRGLKKRKR